MAGERPACKILHAEPGAINNWSFRVGSPTGWTNTNDDLTTFANPNNNVTPLWRGAVGLGIPLESNEA